MSGEVEDDKLPWNFGLLSRAAEMRLRLRYGYGDLERQQRLIERDLRDAALPSPPQEQEG